MKQLVIKNITKEYGQGISKVAALNDVSFEINQGEFVVILGASGAGKSTLLNILGGMDHATSGVYMLNDLEVTTLNDKKLALFRRNHIGFVFQFYNLMPNLTALENVQLSESICATSMPSLEALKLVNLDNRINNFPSELSGGEQQRVAIARAVVKNPTILLCDEPTGALDSKTGQLIIQLLHDVCRDTNKTIIIVTHNSAISELADRVIKVQDGKIMDNMVQKNPKKVCDIVW